MFSESGLAISESDTDTDWNDYA